MGREINFGEAPHLMSTARGASPPHIPERGRTGGACRPRETLAGLGDHRPKLLPATWHLLAPPPPDGAGGCFSTSISVHTSFPGPPWVTLSKVTFSAQKWCRPCEGMEREAAPTPRTSLPSAPSPGSTPPSSSCRPGSMAMSPGRLSPVLALVSKGRRDTGQVVGYPFT